jgi:hypothetical protein
MPLISFIVLVYNSGKYIRRCLHSYEPQTWPDFEAIVPSSDVRFRRQVLAGSDRGAARNYGIQKSRGE